MGKRERLLKDCAQMAGVDMDGSRVDDHDQEVIWDILEWAEPLFRFRHRLIEAARMAGLKEGDLK